MTSPAAYFTTPAPTTSPTSPAASISAAASPAAAQPHSIRRTRTRPPKESDDAFITIYPDKRPRRTLPRACWLMLAAIIIIGVVAIAVANSGPRLPRVVDVVNFDALSIEIPSGTQKNLSAQLYYLLSQHFDVPEKAHSVQATLRPETLQTSSADGLENASFLLDVDAFQQSYAVGLAWSSNGEAVSEDVLVECARRDLSKFPAATCFGMSSDSSSPQLYLPYSGELSSGAGFSARYLYLDADGSDVLELSVENCGDPALSADALAALKEHLAAVGLDPETFRYETLSVYDHCLIERGES